MLIQNCFLSVEARCSVSNVFTQFSLINTHYDNPPESLKSVKGVMVVGVKLETGNPDLIF